MNHFVLDAFKSYRSRLDDILLIYELLEEIPQKMGLKVVMPPFVLPYYNGVVPEDCGISGFVFLAGGHFTIHTFSYREAYFADLFYPEKFDSRSLEEALKDAFPAEKIESYCAVRGKNEAFPKTVKIDESVDFGPHLMIDYEEYTAPVSLDELFDLFDGLPYKIGMTPIMRPYALKSKFQGQKVVSVMTMIAESHISLHCFPETGKAYFDIFSCRFFKFEEVAGKIKQGFKALASKEIFISRGSKYRHFRSTSDVQANKSRSWLENI